jgi:hypothetical protein
MAGFNPSIGGQVAGELKQLGKDIGKSLADIPSQILEDSAKQSSNKSEPSATKPGDAEGKALETGRSSDDPTQAKKQTPQTSGQGWGDAFKAQIFGQKHTQRRLAQIRRNLDQEMERIRRQNEHQEQQQKHQEEQQKEMIKEHREEQKKETQKQSRIRQMLGLGKGERMGTKGK